MSEVVVLYLFEGDLSRGFEGKYLGCGSQRKSFSKGVDRVAFIWYNIIVHEKNRIIHIATLVDGVRSIFCDMVEYLLYARDAFLFY